MQAALGIVIPVGGHAFAAPVGGRQRFGYVKLSLWLRCNIVFPLTASLLGNEAPHRSAGVLLDQLASCQLDTVALNLR